MNISVMSEHGVETDRQTDGHDRTHVRLLHQPAQLTIPVKESLCGAESIGSQLGLLGRARGVGGPLLRLCLLLLPLGLATATAVACSGAGALGSWRPLDWSWVWVAVVGSHGWSWTTQPTLGGHGQLATETHHHPCGPQAPAHHLINTARHECDPWVTLG